MSDVLPKFKVWHIPQVPMRSFEVECATYAEARKVCDVLGNYDAFQFETNVKGDYCNVNGILWPHPKHTFSVDEENDKVDEWDQCEPEDIEYLEEETGHPEWFAK